jgi:NADH-quinone oxidoreductase subunit B
MDLQSKIQRGGTMSGNNGLPELLEREAMLQQKRVLPAGYGLAGERADEGRYGFDLPGGEAALGVDETK